MLGEAQLQIERKTGSVAFAGLDTEPSQLEKLKTFRFT